MRGWGAIFNDYFGPVFWADFSNIAPEIDSGVEMLENDLFSDD